MGQRLGIWRANATVSTARLCNETAVSLLAGMNTGIGKARNTATTARRCSGTAVSQPGGHEYWLREGKRHRVDGPAVQISGGAAADGTEEYWIDGVQVPADQYEFLVACRGDTRRVASPTERPTGDPQALGSPVRPGV